MVQLDTGEAHEVIKQEGKHRKTRPDFKIKQELTTKQDKREHTGRHNSNFKIKQEHQTQTMTIIT